MKNPQTIRLLCMRYGLCIGMNNWTHDVGTFRTTTFGTISIRFDCTFLSLYFRILQSMKSGKWQWNGFAKRSKNFDAVSTQFHAQNELNWKWKIATDRYFSLSFWWCALQFIAPDSELRVPWMQDTQKQSIDDHKVTGQFFVVILLDTFTHTVHDIFERNSLFHCLQPIKRNYNR